MLLQAAALLLLCSSSCKKGGDKKPASSAGVAQTTVSFSTGRYVSGTLKPFILTAQDEVALVHAASAERSVAKPAVPGGNSSLFMFNLKTPVKGDVLLGYYPAASAVKVGATAATFSFAAAQDGTDNFTSIRLGTTATSGSSYTGNNITLTPMYALLVARIQKGDYSVVKGELQARGGEGIAGEVTYDYAAKRCTGGTENTITLTPAEPIDCRTAARSMTFFLPPMTLSDGFKVTFTLSDESTIVLDMPGKKDVEPVSVLDTDPVSSGRKLIACGSSKVYIFDEAIAREAGEYKPALIWSWDAKTAATTVGQAANRMDHIDDAKPVMDGKKLLVTSSYGWALLLDIDTKKVEWSASDVSNAHSAEILPGNRVAVACAAGTVQFYSLSSSTQLGSYPLSSAHGVVWNDKTQRLYAIGDTSLQIYALQDWDTVTPSLKLEKTVSTSGFVTALHDMLLVDENTLSVAGSKAALYTISTGRFTQMTHFNNYAGVKSLNYNPATGEAYYTYAWTGHSEGDYEWSSHKVRFTDEVFANDAGLDKEVIEVDDINMYKVRVLTW